MTRETWKDVVGYEGHYIVSNLGNVKSIKRQPQAMNQFTNSKGYMRLTLTKNGKMKQVFVHRLVVLAFIGNIKEGYVVNHKDGRKNNNALKNLEIITQQENAWHSVNVLKNNIREVYMLHPDTFEVIREFPTVARASQELAIEDSSIYRVCEMKRNFAGGYSWIYADQHKPRNIEEKRLRRDRKLDGRKTINQIDLKTGLVINSFPSMNEAKRQTGISTIAHCVTGRISKAGGYYWEYEKRRELHDYRT